MKAVIVTKYGGPDVVVIEERPAPTVGPRDVLIDVKAASLNPVDYKIREGKLKLIEPLTFPFVMGCDVAGVVRAIGAEVTKFQIGDEVFARLEKGRMGGLAQQVAAIESVVAKKPACTFEEAASLPLAAMTALQALREDAQLVAGQRVLITAGAGGVGSLAIQIAKILGLHVTTTTSTKNVEFVRSLGADEVIDYTKEEINAKPHDFDAAFDMLGGESELAAIRATKRGGRVVGIGGMPDGATAERLMPSWIRPVLWLITGKRRRTAARAGVHYNYLYMRPDGAQLAEVASWVDAKTLRPVIHQTYPLDEVKEAFAELERGKARGKIVVTI